MKHASEGQPRAGMLPKKLGLSVTCARSGTPLRDGGLWETQAGAGTPLRGAAVHG